MSVAKKFLKISDPLLKERPNLEDFFLRPDNFPENHNWVWPETNPFIEYYPNWLSQYESNQIYNTLINYPYWQQNTIVVYGKAHLAPRLEAMVGYNDICYSYSGQKMQTQPWPKILFPLLKKLNKQFQLHFNCCLMNYYRDGQDCVGWHADNEPELGSKPKIASISLGTQRNFQIQHIKDKEFYKFNLNHGSLLFTKGIFHEEWQHRIPRQKIIKTPRINLTFRIISNTK